MKSVVRFRYLKRPAAVAPAQPGKLAALQDAAPARAAPLASLASRAPHPRRTAHAATITELCSGEDLPEVEIVSLLQERIPKYRLRADSITQFGGYENQDWFIPSPALKVDDADLALSPDQIRETLNYFLLCSNRVSQMTRTYNDIEAVTRLLEEKEKDLELTARIGKELLTANGRLEARVGVLEGELRAARDLTTQLQHDLIKKSELLQVLTNDTEEGGCDETDSLLSAEVLQRRAGALERENRALREEADRLAAGTNEAEEAERRLLRDIAAQLAEANSEANSMGTELASERNRAHELQTQLDYTTQRLTTAQRQLSQMTAEHEHTVQVLEITRENQNALAAELAEAKERYAELLGHLAEVQEQLRAMRRGKAPSTRGIMPHVALAAGLQPDSLQSELHSSIYSDLSMDSGIGDVNRSMTNGSVKRVFDTVRTATAWSSIETARPHSCHSAADSVIDNVSEADEEEMYPGGLGGAGVPGAPGAAELAAALRRLTPGEVAGRRAALAASNTYFNTSFHYSNKDDSLSSTWGGNTWRLPSKLQIVKPLEGSATLHTWAQLAKPTMSGLLEERGGAGARRSAAELGLHGRTYHLSDMEEDDEAPLSRVRAHGSSHVYTITNSMVMHPDDGSMTSSVMSSAMGSAMSSARGSAASSAWSSLASSRRPSAAPSVCHSPPSASRRTSVARDLAPTATPTNSPALSPDNSPPPSPTPSSGPSLHSLIRSGTDILRRTFASTADIGSPSPLALQTPGALYAGLAHRSPMEQLTCLKRTLYPIGPAATPLSPSPAFITMGVPAQTGSGALERTVAPPGMGTGRGRTAARARPRSDLGTVGVKPAVTSPAPAAPQQHSTLGTLSSLLFGRKGGLL